MPRTSSLKFLLRTPKVSVKCTTLCSLGRRLGFQLLIDILLAMNLWQVYSWFVPTTLCHCPKILVLTRICTSARDSGATPKNYTSSVALCVYTIMLPCFTPYANALGVKITYEIAYVLPYVGNLVMADKEN